MLLLKGPTLLWCWATVACFLVSGFLISTTSSGRVQKFQNSFGLFYMISGFAMTKADDYEVVYQRTRCECRQRCHADVRCHSVSIVPGNSSEMFECRLSPEPVDIDSNQDRPFLERVQGSVHFLQTSKDRWKEPEADGMIYETINSTWGAAQDNCKNKLDTFHDFGFVESQEMFEVFKKFVGTGGLNIFMRQLSDDGEPTFGYHNCRVTISEVGLSTDLMSEVKGYCSTFYMVKKGDGSFKFLCTHKQVVRPTLCQKNILNLNW